MSDKKIDYQALLDTAKTATELTDVFRRMDEDAKDISLLPRKDDSGVIELFFLGLDGVENSFFIFEAEHLAKRFQVNGSNENAIIYPVINGKTYYLPYANTH